MRTSLVSWLVVLASPALVRGQSPTPTASQAYTPEILPDDGQALQSLARVQVADGFKAELFACEPMCANLVAIAFDEKGRCYAVETFRLNRQVLDIRSHLDWLEDDLACRSVADRVAMIFKHEGANAEIYRKERERVRLLVDKDGDGRADWSTVFADGFNDYADGVAAGVLARKGDVFFADIPNLWRLRDADGDGVADSEEVMSTGYGVHFNFIGHDLHGLRIGPDGRLYFSIGDRGLNVTTKEGVHLESVDTGAVLRCELDGSRLELVHTGLRNPQELAFNDVGDLFTCDNNSDSGDQARLVHVVEGGDSGWRVGWQWLERPIPRGPWNGEKMWHPRNGEQPAYIQPCVANLVGGPSGLAHAPGTGFPERFNDRFFICDFEGQFDNTRVVAFAVKPAGATYELASQEDFVKRGIVATDCEFAPDGCMYVSDWVGGWTEPKRGRIWRVYSPEGRASELAAQTRKLIEEGMEGKNQNELVSLLAHADQRIRQEAQFELANRGAIAVLIDAAQPATTSPIARLHAVWGLGQMARRDPAAIVPLVSLLRDGDPQVRAQAARVLGDAAACDAKSAPSMFDGLVALLADGAPRVRFFAAQALGHCKDARAIPPLIQMVRANNDADVGLRHAGVMGLVGCATAQQLVAMTDDASPAVRMAALLAMRRRGMTEISLLLRDPDTRLAIEAARAIYDVPIASALPALAAWLDHPKLIDPALLLRAVNANLRLGGVENAARLATTAAQVDLPDAIRLDALKALTDFDAPPARDRLLGVFRPCAPNRPPCAADAARPFLHDWLANSFDDLREAAARLVTKGRVVGCSDELVALIGEPGRTTPVRIAALEALTALNDAQLRASIEKALADHDERLRGAARHSLAQIDPKLALEILGRTLENGRQIEMQDAFATLGEMKDAGATALIAKWLDRLLARTVPPELTLDLLAAAQQKNDDDVKARLARFEAARPKDDPLAPWQECLVGGDAQRGRRLALERSDFTCLKCHKIGDQGAGEAGPNLAGIGAKQTRNYLLESIVFPNKQIAAGYKSTLFVMNSGDIVDGRVTGETPTQWQVITTDRGAIALEKSDVKSTREGLSAMLNDFAQRITKQELRDLVEYLASLR